MKKKKKRQNFVDILLKILGRFLDFLVYLSQKHLKSPSLASAGKQIISPSLAEGD